MYMYAHVEIGVYPKTYVNYVYTQINQSLGLSVCLPTHPHFIKHLQAGKHQRNAFKSLIYYSDGEKILMFFPPGSELNARITIAF